ncbi:MAG: antibiotic biosynthesis monooxygenase [Betaproteobacteria bacterium]|nr:antibiotic biosynthesis monooxygenase [Betaproteobacteria bacterium]
MKAMPGFAVIYRWRLKPGKEEQFIDAWVRITQLYVEHRGGLGSRLHKGPDGIWYAYAQWASADARTAAFAGPSLDADAGSRMRDAIAESFDEIVLRPVADLLQH